LGNNDYVFGAEGEFAFWHKDCNTDNSSKMIFLLFVRTKIVMFDSSLEAST
jgi:hypothetical protein